LSAGIEGAIARGTYRKASLFTTGNKSLRFFNILSPLRRQGAIRRDGG